MRSLRLRLARRDLTALSVALSVAALASLMVLPGGDGSTVLVGVLLLANVVVTAAAMLAARRTAHNTPVQSFPGLHDPLTGLPNRTLFRDRAQQAVLAAGRDGSTVAVLLVDLDRFKEVNETLGHAVGDLLLHEVGVRFRGVFRLADTVARLGGDEFGIVLHRTDPQLVPAVADKVRLVLESPIVLGGLSLNVEASVGIAIYPDHGVDADALIQRADVAMYAAKASGSGVAVYAADQDPSSASRLTLVGDLRAAIDLGQLEVHYQPKADLAAAQVVGVEALLRWTHPQRGSVPPQEFVSLAEQTSLIGPLTLYVLDEALRQTRSWHDSGFVVDMAVNLSARNLHDVNFPEDVSVLLQKHRVPARYLELEITESTIMSDPARALMVMTRLSQLGVRFAIDDFGTGYSSLGYLKRLPVSVLKVDRSFVVDMADDESDLAIVRSTIELAHNLGLRVVAEGVETAAVWELLVQLGCDLAQGYHLGRAIPAAELTRRFTGTGHRRIAPG